MSLLCWSPTQGQLTKANTIKVYTQVQEVLLGGWFRSKLIVGNYTKQFYCDLFPRAQTVTEYVINLALESFLVIAEIYEKVSL